MKKPCALLCFLFLILGLLLCLSACKPIVEDEFFGQSAPTFSQVELELTAMMQLTYAYHETQFHLPTATPTPLFTATHTPWPTVISTIARTPSPEITPTDEKACNRAGMGVPFDITVPDNSTFYAGEPFTKTWRVVNSGSCKWTRLYKLVFYSQNAMGAQYERFLEGEVLPGQAIDLSINMIAPTDPGTYQGNWMLQAPDGTLFGLGMNADTPFFVRVVVTDDATPTPTIDPSITPDASFTPEPSPTP